jgi:hypothetical protein
VDAILSVLAIVDACDTDPVVWWVDLGPGKGMFRLCGAWVLDTEDLNGHLTDLVVGRRLLVTAAGRAALADSRLPLHNLIDADALRDAVVQWRDELQAAYEERARQGPTGKGLAAPRWPDIPEPLDVETATADAGDPRTSRALAIARWFDVLCFAWTSIENQRLTRPYLRKLGGDSARPLPIAFEEAGVPA